MNLLTDGLLVHQSPDDDGLIAQLRLIDCQPRGIVVSQRNRRPQPERQLAAEDDARFR